MQSEAHFSLPDFNTLHRRLGGDEALKRLLFHFYADTLASYRYTFSHAPRERVEQCDCRNALPAYDGAGAFLLPCDEDERAG